MASRKRLRAKADLATTRTLQTVKRLPVQGGGMDGEEGEWVELVRDGLTFDLTGLAPRPPSTFPLVAHPFDLPRITRCGPGSRSSISHWAAILPVERA